MLNRSAGKPQKLLFAALSVCLCLFWGGCVFDLPLTSEPTAPIDKYLIGEWKQTVGGRIVKITEDYTGHYAVKFDNKVFDAHHSDIGAARFLTLRLYGELKFVYFKYDFDDGGRLRVRMVDDKLFPASVNTTDKIQTVIKNNLDNPKLFLKTEILLEKTSGTMPPRGATNGDAAAGKGLKTENVIVAGKGWGKVALGTKPGEIEAALGKPEKVSGGNEYFPDVIFWSYPAKGVNITFERKTMLVNEIRFIGDAVLYNGEKTAYKSFQGKPDKNLSWGANVAQVIKAYGEPPYKRENTLDDGSKVAILYYDKITFVIKGDKLHSINIP